MEGEKKWLRPEAWSLCGRYTTLELGPVHGDCQVKSAHSGWDGDAILEKEAGCDERGPVIGPRWWGSGWAWTRLAATEGLRLAAVSAARHSPPSSAWWGGRRPTPGWAWRQTGLASLGRTAVPWWTAFCQTTNTRSQQCYQITVIWSVFHQTFMHGTKSI